MKNLQIDGRTDGRMNRQTGRGMVDRQRKSSLEPLTQKFFIETVNKEMKTKIKSTKQRISQ